MKNVKLFALLSLLFISSAVAQTDAPASDLEANLRKHVQYLASDQLEGRRTGEPGAAAAARYVAKQFERFKLKPGAKATKGEAGFLQSFPYVAGVSVGDASTLKLIPTGASWTDVFKPGENYTPYANSINGDVPDAPLVYTGYGIATPDKKHDDYAGLDVNGKIIIALDGSPDAGDPHSELNAFASIHAKASLAKERGAKALILVAPTDNFKTDPLARLRYEPTTGETSIPVVIVDKAAAAPFLNANTKATAQVKVNLVKKTVDAYNVIGILEGTDPTLKSEAIVIGAHYDHLGHGGQGSLSPNTTDIHHGADDNASGTAAVIELARQFAKAKNNKRTIIFMSFGGEEEGLLGSKFYVNNPVWPLDKTVAMINLDMVGRLNENKLTIGGIGTAAEWKRIVEGFNTSLAELLTTNLGGKKYDDLTPGNAPRFALQLNEDGFGPSDHSSFYSKQVPVLFFFTGTHLDYHKPSDTPEKINFAGLQRVAHFVADIVTSVDETAARPTYAVAQSSSNAAPRTAFTISLGTIPNYAETNDGLGIDGVRDGGPAAKAGLKGGDKIIKLAGKEVRNISDYMFAMSTMKAGEEYEVVVKRGTEIVTLKIIPAPAARR